MAINGIAHYNFRLERSLMEKVRTFYETAVGLSVGPRPPFTSFGYWLYAGEKDILHLSEERPGDERRIGADLTFDHVALEATNCSAHKDQLRQIEVGFTEDVVPGSGRRQLFFRDPAGNGVELIFPAGDN